MDKNVKRNVREMSNSFSQTESDAGTNTLPRDEDVLDELRDAPETGERMNLPESEWHIKTSQMPMVIWKFPTLCGEESKQSSPEVGSFWKALSGRR